MKIKKINKELSLYNIYARGFMIIGALMLVMSICRFFKDNEVMVVIAGIISILAAILCFLPCLFKRQKSDEMFHKNFAKAGLNTMCVMLFSMAILWSLSCIFEERIVFGFYEFGPVLMGILVLTFGFFVNKYERGDV